MTGGRAGGAVLLRVAPPLVWPVIRAIHWLPLLLVALVVPVLAGLARLARPLTGTEALILLRGAGLLLGAAAAYALVDAMAASTGAVPAPRWLRQWLRTTLALGYATAAWVVTYGIVGLCAVELPPLPDTGLEVLVCVAVALAGGGFVVRRVPEPPGATGGAAVLFALLVATLFVPAGWSPWAGPDSPHWDAIRTGWLLAVPALLFALALAHRDTR